MRYLITLHGLSIQKSVHSRKGIHRTDTASTNLSMKEEVASLLSRSLGLLRWCLFLLLLLFLLTVVVVVLRRATLGASSGGNARALPCSLCRWLLLFLGSFGLWLSFLGAGCLLATVGLWLLFLLLLALLFAILLHFGIFLRVGFGDRSAFGWLVLGSCFILVAAAALFVLFGDFASL